VLVAVLLLGPLVALVARVTGDFTTTWDATRSREHLGRVTFNTTVLTVGSLLVALAIGGGIAWCLRHLPLRTRRIGLGITLIPLLVPALPSIMAWVLLLQPRAGLLNQLLRATPLFGGSEGPLDVYTLPFIILLTGVHYVPFVALFLTTALEGLDARLDHAARVSGAGWLWTQLRIVAPLVRPAMVYAGCLVAIFGLGQFTTPLILGRPHNFNVLTTEMWRSVNYSPVSYEVAALLGAPLVLLGFVIVSGQRRLIGASERYVSASRGMEAEVGERRWPLVPVVVFGVVMVVPPLAMLIWTSLLPYWNPTLGLSSVSLDNYRKLLDDPGTWHAIRNTVTFAVAGTVVGLSACTYLAVIAVRRANSARGRAIDYLINLPITIPGIVFGLGIYLAFATGPVDLAGSALLFVAIYVLTTLPQGTRLVMAGITQLAPSSESAARVHGASPVRSLVLVLLPLLRRSLASAMIVLFIVMVQEFGAATMVQSPQTEVMATKMFAMWEEGFSQTEAAAMAVVMCGLCLVGVVLLLRFSSHGLRLRRGRRSRLFGDDVVLVTGAR
jgi:iron(III) transport system permease protein